MNEQKYLLALDSGSQSSRALLFDARGEVVAVGRKNHAPMRHPEPGAVEQDPIDIREALFAAMKQCMDRFDGDRTAIVGAALTTQRTTVLPVAEDGTPLGDAVSWLDRRTASLDSEPSAFLRTFLRSLGENTLVPRLLAKSWPRLWRERRPELLEQLTWIAPIESWLGHQLTGNMAVAPGGLVGTWPFDIAGRRWSTSSLMYKLLAFRKEWLPRIVEPAEQIGRIAEQAANLTGVPKFLPLYACGGDKQAEVFGAGLSFKDTGQAAVSLGTGSSVCIPWPKPVQSRKYHWFALAGAEPGCYCHEYMVFRGMWTARWFAHQMARDLEQVAERTGKAVEALLCDEAAQVQPGSDGLSVWPRWSPSLQHPLETGAAVGLRETHTRGHFFRALLEGIAFDLKRGLGILERALGTRVEKIVVGGGGARSDMVVRILADTLNLPVSRPPSEELSARGAAMVAALGSGVYKSPAEAIEHMSSDAPVIAPDFQHARLYADLYKHVYLPGLKSCHSISASLRQVHELMAHRHE